MMMRLSAVIFAVSMTMVSSTLEECTLDCNGVGTCMVGSADFSDLTPVLNGQKAFIPFFNTTNIQNQHCKCDPGYTGVNCGHTVQSCNSPDTIGFTFRCFHGAQCNLGLTDEYGNAQYYCDCTTTNHPENKRYAGHYCQFEEAERCDMDGNTFCVNGGTCKDNSESKKNPCKCGEDFEGRHCEWETGFMPNCDLECANNGECVLGFKSYDAAVTQIDLPFLETKQINMMHCDCPEGFTGVRCEVEIGEKCASDKCYHGSKCVKTNVDEFCDCNSIEKDSSYSGRYCEYGAITWCSNRKNHNGQPFCVNEGTCNVQPHEGCDCPDGFKGSQCEYKSDAIMPSCTLECSNDGKCRKGSKDFGTTKGSNWGLEFLNKTHINYEHCVCPDGYTGLQCEYEIETCANGEHHCINGGTCVRVIGEGGKVKHGCDCESASNSTHKFGGLICEHSSTSLCIVHDTSSLGEDDGTNLVGFCTNDGVCKTKNQKDGSHPGCECIEGFEGEHCELKFGISAPDSVTLIEHSEYKNKGSACSLDCSGSGTCQIGNDESAFCKCQPGYTGISCQEIFQSCNTPDKDGAVLGCFHNSNCVSGYNDKYGNEQFHCDCTTAKHPDKYRYSGLFCQFETVERCTNENDFCVNGGICKTEAENTTKVCECFGDFDGPHCEWAKGFMPDCDLECENNGECVVGFISYDDAISAITGKNDGAKQHMRCSCPNGFTGEKCEVEEGLSCHLECSNNGRCRKGAKDFGTAKGSQWGLEFLNKTHINYEHCVCPNGFTGLQCEYEVETCANGEHNCLKGGTCVKVTGEGGKVKHGCDCKSASNSTHKFAGLFCEHSSTSLCMGHDTSSLGEDNGTNLAEFGSNLVGFCTNGGVCKTNAQEDGSHPGCECMEGFEGEHCELKFGISIPDSVTLINQSSRYDDGSNIFVFFFSLVFVGLVTLTLFLYVKKVDIENIIKKRNLDLSSGTLSEMHPSSNHPTKGFDPESFLEEINSIEDESDFAERYII